MTPLLRVGFSRVHTDTRSHRLYDELESPVSSTSCSVEKQASERRRVVCSVPRHIIQGGERAGRKTGIAPLKISAHPPLPVCIGAYMYLVCVLAWFCVCLWQETLQYL